MENNYAIEVNNLTKIFGSRIGKNRRVTALDNFSLNVEKGKAFGLLGPNGAGKTTLVKILLGITFPSVGNAKILGHDTNDYKIKYKVGYLPENHKFPPYYTGEQVMEFTAKLTGVDHDKMGKRINELLDLVKMKKWKKTKVRNYSKGMMQRLGLAQAMINDPELLFFDEPTDGVDPIGRKEIRDVLVELKNRGKTIFLNSHLLSEVERMTDYVVILNKGKTVKSGTIEELTSEKDYYDIKTAGNVTSDFISANLNRFLIKDIKEDGFTAKVDNTAALNNLIDLLRQNSIDITGVIPRKETLEDLFISVISESDKQAAQ